MNRDFLMGVRIAADGGVGVIMARGEGCSSDISRWNESTGWKADGFMTGVIVGVIRGPLAGVDGRGWGSTLLPFLLESSIPAF